MSRRASWEEVGSPAVISGSCGAFMLRLSSSLQQATKSHQSQDPAFKQRKIWFLKGAVASNGRREALFWFKLVGFYWFLPGKMYIFKAKSDYVKLFDLFSWVAHIYNTNNDITISFNKLRGDFMVVSICLLKDESKRGSHLECEARLPCTSPFFPGKESIIFQTLYQNRLHVRPT